MPDDATKSRLTVLLALLLAWSPLQAQEQASGDAGAPATEAPIATALTELSEDVRTYNDHIVTLASPFMEGRVPGSRGMETAKEYAIFWFEKAGLVPAFPGESDDGSTAPRTSWRQAFPLGGTRRVVGQHLAWKGSGELAGGRDYLALAYGVSGDVTAPLVFAGYGIRRGPDGFTSFSEDVDLEGRIAVIFRFEPMDDEGESRWAERGWSPRAAFRGKIRACERRGAAGLVIVNPPGCADPRSRKIEPGTGARTSRALGDLPVVLLDTAAGERLVGAGTSGKSLAELRRLADGGRACLDLGVEATLRVDIERKELHAENVAGLLPGRGELADELVVVGAHLDHLGLGYFGSRAGPGKLHPGADDNASGSAAVLMLADKLARAYESLPAEAPARAIMFACWSAEESGLHGSRYYTENPIVPLEKHALKINFDMIGRIRNQRLKISGVGTARGMEEWLDPILEDTPLTVVKSRRSSGGSDHLPFLQKRVPVLFGAIADFHGDYHTPNDVSSKINRVDATHTVRLFEKITLGAATREEPFEFTSRRVER